MDALNIMGPVILVIALGAALRHWRFLDATVHTGITRTCYWVSLPCLLFTKIVDAPAVSGAATRIAVVVIAVTVVLALAGFLVALAARLDRRSIGAVIQSSFRGNLAFVGLPVVILAFAGTPDAGRAEAAMVLSLPSVVIFYNVLAVLVLLVPQGHVGMSAARRLGVNMATNPLIISCALGYVCKQAATVLPFDVPGGLMLMRAMELVGRFALPGALLVVGSALVSTPLRGRLGLAMSAAVVKTVIGPLLGLLAAWFWGLSAMETRVILIMLAAPTAIVSYVLTTQLGGDGTVSAASIVLSTLLSCVTLSVIVVLSG